MIDIFMKTAIVFNCKTVDYEFEQFQEPVPHAGGANTKDSNQLLGSILR